MTCVGFIEPLNLKCWFVNTFAGSIELFSAIALIIISSLAAKLRMPNGVFLIMVGLFVIIMQRYMQGIYLLIVTLTGLITFYAIGKVIKN